MFLTLLAVAAVTVPSGASPAPHPDAAAAADSGRFVDGSHSGPAGSRAYKLYLPPEREQAGGTAHPLLVVLHGCTQTADDVSRGTRLNAIAGAEGMLVLYPEQPADAHPQRCWNWYDPAHQGRDAGEPAILAAMTREVMARHGGDPRRVYVAGISAGGAMALTLAATHPDLFAAAAVHSAVPFAAATNVGEALAAMRQGGTARPEALLAAMGARRRLVPLLVIHGSADAVVSPTNAEAIAEQWGRAFGLTGEPHTTRIQDAVRGDGTRLERPFRATRYRLPATVVTPSPAEPPPPMAAGVQSPLELVIVEGLGHAWSGGSAEGTFTDPNSPSASEWIVRFLRGHAMPVEVRK